MWSTSGPCSLAEASAVSHQRSRRSSASASRSAGGEMGPKWVSTRWAGERAAKARRLWIARSRSKSGGGVAGRSTLVLGSSTPTPSPANSVPASGSNTPMWWRAWPGAWSSSSRRPPRSMTSPSSAALILEASTGVSPP